MDSLNFAELKGKDVRSYWKDEAKDFTPWLAKKIRSDDTSALEDEIDIDLESVKTEKSVGKYSLDILAQSMEGEKQVVIENQLNPSDHDHLGKTIAYASGIDADVIIWISPKFNDEHKDAVKWLNKNSREGIDFFAIRLEIWQIEDSCPAVRFNSVVEPSEWVKKAKRSDKELTENEKMREEFWTQLRDKIEERNTNLRARKPQTNNWYKNPIGKSNMHLSFNFYTNKNQIACSLVIRDNAEAYEMLKDEKDEIEQEIEKELIWVPPSDTDTDRDRAKIRAIKGVKDLEDRGEWDNYLEWLINMGEKFYDSFYERLQQI